MRFSSAEELDLASEEVIEEIFSEEHEDDVGFLAGTALLNGRTSSQAITLLIGAALELATENTADAQIAIAANLASAKALNGAIQATIDEAAATEAIAELETQGPVAFILKALGFHNGGVVSP